VSRRASPNAFRIQYTHRALSLGSPPVSTEEKPRPRLRGLLLCLGLALIGVLQTAAPGRAGVLDVSWIEPTTNTDGSPLTDLGHYLVFYGPSNEPCAGPSVVAVAASTPSPRPGQSATVRLTGLLSGSLYYVAVLAVDSNGNESACSTPASAVAQPLFTVSPTGSGHFGTVAVGSFADLTFTVQNNRAGTISGTVSTSLPFSIVSGSPFTLVGAGATQVVTVRFTPTTSATAAANVIFTAQGETISRIVTGETDMAVLTSPTPGSTLPGSTATFSWSDAIGATEYRLSIGTTGVGSGDLYDQSQGTNTSVTVSGLPLDGRTLYARLSSLVGGQWVFSDYVYTAARLAVLTSPPPGSTLAGATVPFSWSAGSGTIEYWLSVGTEGRGCCDLYSQSQGANTVATVGGLPTDGRTVNVRLWSLLGNGSGWASNDYSYTAATQTPAVLTNAPQFSTLPGTSVTFTWSTGHGATQYSLSVGTTGPGSFDVYSQPPGTNLSAVVTGLPVDGRTIYVRLSTELGGVWHPVDYVFIAATHSQPPATPTLVQHVQGAKTRADASASKIDVSLPNPAGGGNALIVSVKANTSSALSVSDDKSNTYLAGPSITDPATGQTGALFYALNVAAGTVKITVSFGAGGGTSATAIVSEFFNVATAAAADGSSSAVSATPVNAGSITTTADRDLIYYAAFSSSAAGSPSPLSFTAGHDFTLLATDVLDGSMAQYLVQGAHGDVNPSMTVSGATTDTFITLAIALKSGAAGTAPGTGLRIVRVQHNNFALDNGGTSYSLQFPSSGNLIVAAWVGFRTDTETNVDILQMADGRGTSYTSVGPAVGNQSSGSAQIFYAANAPPGPNLITLILSTPQRGSHLLLYDVAGADASPFDVAALATGNQTSAGDVTTVTITPTHSNGLVIGLTDLNSHAISGVVGSSFLFDSVTYPEEDESGRPDDGAGHAHVYNSDTSPLTFIWTAGPGSGEAGRWAAYAAAFKAALPAALTSPVPGSTLAGRTATFSWTPGTNATLYWLTIGTTGADSDDLYGEPQGTDLSATVSGLPVNRSTLYVRLWSLQAGSWQFNDYTYTAASPVAAVMTSPAPGSILPGTAATFVWTAGLGATPYLLTVGSTGAGSTNLYVLYADSTSATVSGLPTDGSTVYVRLWSLLGGTSWQFNDYTYTAATIPTYTLTVSANGAGSGIVTSVPAGISCGATCAATFTSGTAVTLTAVPAAGSLFTGWSGGGCSGTGTCTVTLGADTTVTATFVPLYTLTVTLSDAGSGTVTSAPAGIDCSATCSASFASGTVVTLTATPAAGFTFTGWSGGGCSGTGACTVTLSAATTVTATFVPLYTLTVNVSGAGSGTVTSVPAGIACGTTCSASFASGTAVVLTATPAAGFTFTGWSGGGCTGTSPCTVTLGANTTVAATFVPLYTLTVNLGGAGSGTVTSAPAGIACGATCSALFASGTAVALTATPAAGFTFTGWSGGGCSGSGTCTVVLNGATTVTATFALQTFTLTVSVAGSGTVTSAPAGISCSATCAASFTSGTWVTLTAVPAAGWTFTGWSGGGCTGAGTCAVTMTAATSVTATFAFTTFTDNPVGAGTTVVKAVHITELRAAINAAQTRNEVPASSWMTDPTIAAGSTTIKAGHIVEMWTAVNQVYTKLGMAPPPYMDSIVPGTVIKAIHVQNLRNAVSALP